MYLEIFHISYVTPMPSTDRGIPIDGVLYMILLHTILKHRISMTSYLFSIYVITTRTSDLMFNVSVSVNLLLVLHESQ